MSEKLLYTRFASLKVVTRDKVGNQLVAKDFEGLRTNFSIEKTSESNANTAKIKIYNLSPASRSFVENKGQALILTAGYAPSGLQPLKGVIFSGDIGIAKNTQEGPDWITSFEVGDGQKNLDEKTYQQTFRKGAKAQEIITEVAGSFGLPVSTIKGVKDKTYKSGLTLSGSSKDIMDQLTLETDTEWSIQDGEVQVLPPSDATADEIIVVSKETGMINSPIKRADGGIDVVSLLNPRFRPGRRIKIVSRFINGIYRIRKVNFEGDTQEGDWKAKLETVDINTQVTSYAKQ